MSTHNIRFHQEIRKILYGYPLLSGAVTKNIAPDERGYLHNIFLISPQKRMLWVLIRSALMRNKKISTTFG